MQLSFMIYRHNVRLTTGYNVTDLVLLGYFVMQYQNLFINLQFRK